MYKIFTVQIVILLQVVEIFAEIKTDKIKALEKEKIELLKQINEAIDESVKVLKDGNDTESKLGVNYMTSLKAQLKEINDTAHMRTNDTRRSDLFKLDVYDLADVFKKNKKSKKKIEGEENKLIVQKKIKEWLLERELEKKKIRQYREKQQLALRFEKCPRFGIGAKTDNVRRSGGGKKEKSRPKYPCCRKCCKKSYMGCL